MEKSSFFKSVAGDRKYKVEDFAAFFSSLVTNGVFPNPSSNLQVIANNNMTVTIKAGKAWINGYVYILDADMILPIEVADGVLKRIDRIVIRYSTVGRAILGGVRKGVFASTPVAPTLVRDADLYELGIADIYVTNGAVSIVGANITDLRMNTSLCGWVNSLIQADTTAIFNQYQAWFTAQSNTYNTEMVANEAAFQTQFNDWFATVQGQLAGDIAGNLAASISNLAGTGRTTETVKGNAAAIASLGSSVATSLAEKATPTTLGRVKVGSRLSIDTNGVLSADVQSVDVSGKIDKNILTATGDIIYASAPNSPSRLGKGTSKQVLTMNEAGTLPEWGSASVNIPIVKVYHSANINTASGTTVTLPFDSEEIDTHAMHDTVTNNSRLTCKEAGKYLIIATVNYAPSNTTGYRSVDLYKNGVTRHGFSFKSNGTSDPTINTVSTIWDMSVSDYIEVKVVQNSTTAIDIIGNAQPISRSELLMMKVG